MKTQKPLQRSLLFLGFTLVVYILFNPFGFLQIERQPYYRDYSDASMAYKLYLRTKSRPPSSLEDFMPMDIRAKMASPDYPIKIDKDQTITYWLASASSLNNVSLVDLIFKRLSLRGIEIGKMDTQP